MRLQQVEGWWSMCVSSVSRGAEVIQGESMTPTKRDSPGIPSLSINGKPEQYKVTPVNTKHLYNIRTMLVQRRRRWAAFVQMLYKCFVFSGIPWIATDKCAPPPPVQQTREIHPELV